MYARLAFSVAIHVDADILLVDEILGVGDVNFQAKCANKIYEMKKNGITIILVTHDMSTIDRLCDYAVWLDHGKKIAEGNPRKIENLYLKYMAEEQEERKKIEKNTSKLEKKIENQEVKVKNLKIEHLGEHFGSEDVLFTNCELLDEKNIDRRSFQMGQGIKLKVGYLCQSDPESLEVNIGFQINNISGTLVYGTDTLRNGYDIKNLKLLKRGTIEIILKNLPLIPGEYTIGVSIKAINNQVCYDQYRNIAEFKIYGNSYDIGLVSLEHQYILDNKEIKKIK